MSDSTKITISGFGCLVFLAAAAIVLGGFVGLVFLIARWVAG